ncbi:MAG TPA: trypsin-like peptidase domain-containing protein [Methylomirabilota bacterium]
MRTSLSSPTIGLLLILVLGLDGGVPAPLLAEPSLTQGLHRRASPRRAGTFARLAEAVKPAVINVSIDKGRGGWPLEGLLGGTVERQPARSLGSGVIVDPSGLALTNAHVVEDARRIEVTMLDGTKYPARLVGIDSETDLAVLRVLADGIRFPFLPLGDSDAVQIGEWVIAVGSPFGLQATVTSGIVSAKPGEVPRGPWGAFLQTDAAINPGNSGGPLVNMRGQVIGINTAIVRAGSGIGLAIPANLVRRISGSAS